MKVGSQGRVTIPKDLRDHFDIQIGDEVVFRTSEEGSKLILEKMENNGNGERSRPDGI